MQLIYTVSFVVLMLLVWLLVCKLSAFAGWSKLCHDFPGTEVPVGEYVRFGFVSIATGNNWVYYGGSVSLIVSDGGLYMKRLWRLLATFHPPMYIPWHAMSLLSAPNKFGGFSSTVPISIQTSGGEVKMVLRGGIVGLVRARISEDKTDVPQMSGEIHIEGK